MAEPEPFGSDWLVKYRDEYARNAGRKLSEEIDMFRDLGAVAASQHYFTLEQTQTICDWKSRRAKGHIAKNKDEIVRFITEKAMSGPPELAVHTLTYLSGVQVPMGSAIMAVAQSDRFTVFDMYAERAMKGYRARFGAGTGTPWQPGYWDYLLACRELSANLDTNLRDLDRALWAYGKELYGR